MLTRLLLISAIVISTSPSQAIYKVCSGKSPFNGQPPTGTCFGLKPLRKDSTGKCPTVKADGGNAEQGGKCVSAGWGFCSMKDKSLEGWVCEGYFDETTQLCAYAGMNPLKGEFPGEGC